MPAQPIYAANGGFAEAWAAGIEVRQSKEELRIRAAFPGLKKEDVRIEVRRDAIVIQGQNGSDPAKHRFGRFYIPLPEGARMDEARSELEDDLLNLSIPVAVSAITVSPAPPI